MKRAIDVVPVNFKTEEDRYAPFTLETRAPGKLRKIMTVLRPPSTIVQASGSPEAAPPIPALVFEIDPEGEKQKRSYMWLSDGVKITFDGNLEYRGHYFDPASGEVMFLYEAFPDKKG